MSLLDLINKERAKLQSGNKGRSEKLNSEKNLVRFILDPATLANGDVAQTWGQHFIKDTGGALKAVYMCTATTFGEKCPICDAIAEGQALTGDEEILKAYKEARSSRRIVVNALYLKGGKHDNPETTPVVLELPPTVWDNVLQTAQAFEEEGVNVFDPKVGHNFIIEKTGSGMGTEYKVTPSPRGSTINGDAVEKIKDLTAWARQESPQERDKAITSVRVIGGYYASTGSADKSLPKLVSGPVATGARTESRLAKLDAEDIVPGMVTTTSNSKALDEMDDFLAGLGE